MKHSKVSNDFQNDKTSIFGKKFNSIILSFPSTGHYFIGIKNSNIDPLNIKSNIVLFRENLELMLVKKIQKVDIKVHRQFSYPHSDTLLTLLKDGNVISSELEQCIKKLDNEWKVCVEYKKTKPRPIIGLPIAERFNET